MSVDRYRTLEGQSTEMLREKASKFIAIAFPIADEDVFKSKLLQFEKEHPSARHFCYAWVLGNGGEQFRANDCGEPNGTAGRPILRRIQALDLTYCGVIVVRYFGGTLLGKAGLVQAYGGAAQLALGSASISDRFVMEQALLTCGYDRFDQIKSDVIECGGSIIESTFTDTCRARVEVPVGTLEHIWPKWELLGAELVLQ